MTMPRVNPPPPPSTPREAPWRELEELIDWLKVVAFRLDQLIAVQTGQPTPTAPATIISPTVIPSDLSAFFRNRKSFMTGQKDVVTAGTPVQLDSFDIPEGFKLIVLAKPGNAGNIFVATNEGYAGNANRRFDALEPGIAIPLRVTNTEAVWIDAEQDGDGVSWYF
jgi:hypothetical protein